MEGFYRMMSRVRGFDQKVTELFQGGEIKGTAHSYVGQEAVAAGCARTSPSGISSQATIAATDTASRRERAWTG